MAALSNFCACGREKEKVSEKTCNDCMDLWGMLDKCALEDGQVEVSVFGVVPCSLLRNFSPGLQVKYRLGLGRGPQINY